MPRTAPKRLIAATLAVAGLVALAALLVAAAPAQALSTKRARAAVVKEVLKRYDAPTRIAVRCRPSGRCRAYFIQADTVCTDERLRVVERRGKLRVRRLNPDCVPIGGEQPPPPPTTPPPGNPPPPPPEGTPPPPPPEGTPPPPPPVPRTSSTDSTTAHAAQGGGWTPFFVSGWYYPPEPVYGTNYYWRWHHWFNAITFNTATCWTYWGYDYYGYLDEWWLDCVPGLL
jgi:hypothetical protein